MRRAVLLAIFALSTGLLLLCIVALAIMWFGEVQALVLPGATDVRIEPPSLARQQITYQLPANRTLADLSAQLVQDGWTRDRQDERLLRRDQIDNVALVLFWRDGWLGLVPEVVTVRPSAKNQRLVDIQLVRCFTIRAWMGCL
jgi:hypothetical protein